ncbi:MAG: peptide deformylase [Planctomycetes bacterium]|nr:peptide deformylase [Planctomycetota bacterium]
MALRLLYYPDPRLQQRAEPIAGIGSDLRDLVPQMFAVMYRHRGIGLAAPQVGISTRLIVANLTGDPEKKEDEQVFINPEILQKSGVMNEEEGCLSLPGLSAKIRRAARVRVRYRDLAGEDQQRECEGLWAKLFQHEIDHLDGILMTDKMTAADLKQWAPLLKELEEDFERPESDGGEVRRTAGASTRLAARARRGNRRHAQAEL